MYRYLLITFTLSTVTYCSPAPSKKDAESRPSPAVLYDQRQEGELNVHADLKNFVILIIPTRAQSNPNASSAELSLLQLLSRSSPRKSLHKNKHNKKQSVVDENSVKDEMKHFIESKSTPYHVDISKARDHLAKLHPVELDNEEIVIANSPAVALVKNGDVKEKVLRRVARAKAFVFEYPEEISRKSVKKEYRKKTIKDLPRSNYKRPDGQTRRDCGPGMVRDSYGICRTYQY